VDDLDRRVRFAAFAFLSAQSIHHPDTWPYEVLKRGFTFDGQRVPLIGPQGIFKPAVLPEMPLRSVRRRSSKAGSDRTTMR
jgi:putative restriction endonuclease